MSSIHKPEIASSILEVLGGLGVPSNMIATSLCLVPDSVSGLLVYGSRARGDSLVESDLDLLALVDSESRTSNQDGVSISFYTKSQLETGISSLFGAHLKRDAKIIYDPAGQLTATITELGDVDPSRVLKRVQQFSIVFGALDRDLPKYLPGLLRLARYLLRSALYAKAISEGNECYSVRELAQRYQDTSLVELLTSRPSGSGTLKELYECIHRLEEIVGPLRANEYQSLESLIINEWNTQSELIAMAIMALGGAESPLGYVEVQKVLL